LDFTDGQTLFALRVQDFTDGQTLFALRCAGYQNLPCEMDPAIHSPFTLSGSRRQPAYLLPLPNLYSLADCLKSCLNQIAITQSVQLCQQVSQTGYGGIKTSSNQQDPSPALA